MTMDNTSYIICLEPKGRQHRVEWYKLKSFWLQTEYPPKPPGVNDEINIQSHQQDREITEL